MGNDGQVSEVSGTVTNSGTIQALGSQDADASEGTVYAIVFGSGNDSLSNSGEIRGSVDLGDGNNNLLLQGPSEITGNITFGCV